MTITRNFKLYLNAGTASAPYINVNQYDEGEEWVFTLYNEDGSTYTPSSGAIIGIKSDGNAIMNAGSVVGGKVVITETEQMTAASGRAIFELLIDNATHGTANFIVNVEQRPGDNADLSDSDLSLIQEAVDSAAEIEDLLGGQDVPTVITPIISDWLDENITNPSNPPIDTSLTVAGAAADAKKTGDEITDLKSAIDYSNVEKVSAFFTGGGISNRTGKDQSNNARCRSGYILLKGGYKFTCNEGQQFVFFEYNVSTGAFVAPMHSAYVSEYDLTNDAYVRVVEKYTNDSTISDPSKFALYREPLKTIGDDVKASSNEIGTSDSIVWAIGSLEASDGTETSNTDNRRLRSNYYEMNGNSIVSIHANGQRYAICLYELDGTFLLNTGWKYSDIELKQENKLVRFVVANIDNSVISADNVAADIKIIYGMLKTDEEANDVISGFVGTPFCQTIKTIMHRGYNSIAPENTIPAFKLAKQMGFGTIETDIQLTSDNVPVVLHDSTVNRTSNGTGNIYDMTLAQAEALDFGSWKSPMYAGTKIPTFEEMLLCCKKIGLDVYIEIKRESPWTQAIMTDCVRKVRECGMRDHVTWISFSETCLGYVKTADSKARLGFLMTTYTTGAVDTCVSLKNGQNEVIAVTRYDLLSDSVLDYMIDNDVPLCAYLFDKNSDADVMQPYVSEVLTNEFNVSKYIYEQNI